MKDESRLDTSLVRVVTVRLLSGNDSLLGQI